MRCCLNYARPSCSSTANNRGLLLAAPPDLVWTQPKDHTYAVRTFHIIFDCRRARCILVAPASSVRRPTRPFYRNSLYYGSLSKFDANSYRWRERRAMARNHTPDYSHANLTMRLLELMETNGDKKSLRSRDNASRLCHRSRAAFSSTFYLYSEASDEKRHAKSTQSHKIGPLRPW